MITFITSTMNQFGYLGIAFLILIENIFPPIPSEVILSFGGFATTLQNSTLTKIGVIIAATVGSVVGAIILYYIGRIINVERIDKFLEKKWVKRLGFKKNEVDRTIKFFEKYEKIAVLFGRCVPIVRSLISIPAGMTKMNTEVFLLYTTIGSLIWNTVIVIAGSMLGENWEIVVNIIGRYGTIVLYILVLVFIYFLIRFFAKRRKK